MIYPKISIITPVFNQVDYIEQTIQSILGQNYPNLEYIIIDGGSTDGTVKLIKQYESKLTYWVSEPDTGMYNAINKGFAKASGAIMGWVNSDDVLMPDALHNMARIFNDLPNVNWIQGLNSFIDTQGQIVRVSPAKRFSSVRYAMRDYQWIQQESTFWKRSLWEQAGSTLNENLKLAGDFELWLRFFKYSKLYNCQIPIGAWRKREGQLSGVSYEAYMQEIQDVYKQTELSKSTAQHVAKIQKLEKRIQWLQRLKIFNTSKAIKTRNRLLEIDNVMITYDMESQQFKIGAN